MASLYNADLKPIGRGVSTHPYDHATKLFLADNYRLAPKQAFLFYVVINVNTTAFDSISSAVKSLIAPDGISSQTLIEQYENGLMAKRVDLPKFTIGTKTLNSYNRKNVIQTSLSYDPINITFHDDAADLITTFWNDYYTFYYRDSDYPSSNLQPDIYRTAHKQAGVYELRQKTGWGFSPRNLTLDPFLKSISIFSLHNKRFTEYVLMNPMITSWRHGNHDSYQDAAIMEHTMSVAYETVKYRTGYINAVDVNGFGVLHYDNVQSPVSTSTTNIYSESGVLGALTNGARDLYRPDGNTGGAGVLGNILNMYKLYNQSKGVNLSGVVKPILGQYATKIVGNVLNGALNAIFVPTNNSSLGSSQVYGSTGSLVNSNPYATSSPFGGVTLGGNPVGVIAGAATNAAVGALDTYIRSGQGQAPQPVIYQVQSTDGVIQVNAQGQPVTGQTTAFIQTAAGEETVSSFQTVTTSSRTYNPNNMSENLKYITPSVDESGQNITEYEYLDGTRVIYNSDTDKVTQVYPGVNSSGAVYAPQNTRDIVAAGQNIPATQVQTYTDPRTGIVYTTGGTVGAYVTNTVSGVGGAVAGATVGQGVNELLNNNTFLGKSAIGQAVSSALSGAAGVIAGRAVNNGLQTILNPVTGSINQAIDNVTGSVKNVLGSWTGTGGPTANNPTENIEMVESINLETGEIYYTYKNQGTAVTKINQETGETYTTVEEPGTDIGSLWYGSGAVSPGVNADTVATDQNIYADYDMGIDSGYNNTWPQEDLWAGNDFPLDPSFGTDNNSYQSSFDDSWDSNFDFSDPFV